MKRETRGGIGHVGAGIIASARIGIADRAPCPRVAHIGVVVFILAVAYSCRRRRICRRRCVRRSVRGGARAGGRVRRRIRGGRRRRICRQWRVRRSAGGRRCIGRREGIGGRRRARIRRRIGRGAGHRRRAGNRRRIRGGRCRRGPAACAARHLVIVADVIGRGDRAVGVVYHLLDTVAVGIIGVIGNRSIAGGHPRQPILRIITERIARVRGHVAVQVVGIGIRPHLRGGVLVRRIAVGVRGRRPAVGALGDVADGIVLPRLGVDVRDARGQKPIDAVVRES